MTAFSPALHRFGDVTVRLSVELGRADMALRDVLALGPGRVVALDRLTDELLDVTANGKVVARGEVVAKDGRFALRVVSLVGEEEALEPGHAAHFADAEAPAAFAAEAAQEADPPTPAAPAANPAASGEPQA
ncbi:MAG: FliM/FliN family flagellar motor switch protein [Erythrobacter sp.]|nr:FliM/FliN family flagellar motor switch protein [Erythrobacter sp.]